MRTFLNAANYQWFPLNAYYNSVCNTNFGDPVITLEELASSVNETTIAAQIYAQTGADV